VTGEQVAQALVAAQADFPALERSKTVTVRGANRKTGREYEYTFSYAPFDAIVATVRPVLARHKLAISQALSHLDGQLALRTVLLHESGERIEDVCPIPVGADATSQEVGSAITYLRRYALCAILGLVAEDDDDGDDGNAASGNRIVSARRRGAREPSDAEGAESPSTAFQPPSGTASDRQKGLLRALARELIEAKAITAEQLDTACRRIVGRDWEDALDLLSVQEASELIGRLERLKRNKVSAAA